MSVMVLSEEKFVQLKKYLVILEGMAEIDSMKYNVKDEWVDVIEEKYRNLVTYFYKMNVLNYCARYNEKIEFIPIDFTLPTKAIDKNEAIDTLRGLRYNTSDYFKTDELNRLINELENI